MLHEALPDEEIDELPPECVTERTVHAPCDCMHTYAHGRTSNHRGYESVNETLNGIVLWQRVNFYVIIPVPLHKIGGPDASCLQIVGNLASCSWHRACL